LLRQIDRSSLLFEAAAAHPQPMTGDQMKTTPEQSR
jgi:hypothetical protein